MKKAFVFVLCAVLVVLFFCLKQNDVTRDTSRHESAASVLPPAPPSFVAMTDPQQEKADDTGHATNHVRKLKRVPRRSHNSEEILAAASKRVLAQTKVPTQALALPPANRPRASDRFSYRVPRVNGERKTEALADSCNNDACQHSQEGYTLVGLVVSTSPARGKDAAYFGGKVDTGDAKRRPLVYLK